MWLLFCYTIQLITIKLCTKFQKPKSSSCWEIWQKKCPYVLYKSDRRKKWKIEKRRQNKDCILIFFYTLYFAYLKVYTKYENTGSNRSCKNCDRIFNWEKEKCINKGTNKQYVAVILLHNTTNHYQVLYSISESSSCWEISDRKKVYRQTDKHCYRKDKNYISSIYFVPGV